MSCALHHRVPGKRIFMERFPFAIVFFADAEPVDILAVEPLKRRPGYWRSCQSVLRYSSSARWLWGVRPSPNVWPAPDWPRSVVSYVSPP